MKRIHLIIILVFITSISFSQNKNGSLLIIGGGNIPDYIIEKFINLGGGPKSKFLIIPLASAEPDNSSKSFSRKLVSAGCQSIETLISIKDNIDTDTNLAKLDNVKGVFFTGGDQSKLKFFLEGSKILEKIKKIYLNGGVIGGTSAGAAVMSNIMITGKELINSDTINAYNVIRKGNIQTTNGFGFINNAIIDQHFLKRKRINRLISLILENPKIIGIGIDESTSIIVRKNKFEVLGESLVTVLHLENHKKIEIDKNQNLSARNIKLHLLKNGDQFALSKN